MGATGGRTRLQQPGDDRPVVYYNYEPLTALAAAAAVTERIGLGTTVLLAPLRPNPTELAKQALSVNAVSGGRFTLGVGLGAREDDYEASGVDLAGRGKRVDAMLERIREVWDGSEIGPRTAGAPRLVVGGHADASFRRAARFADGWIASGGPLEQDDETVRAYVAGFEEAGCDELILFPSSSDPDQVDLLAGAVGL